MDIDTLNIRNSIAQQIYVQLILNANSPRPDVHARHASAAFDWANAFANEHIKRAANADGGT